MRDFVNTVGFIYNGTHNTRMGTLYLLENEDMEYRYDEFDNSTLAVPKMIGEYDLEPTIKGKEIDVKVYYENLTEYEYEELFKWIRPTKGLNSLIFDNQKDVVYQVRLSKKPSSKKYEVKNGYTGIIEYRFDCPSGYGTGKKQEINKQTENESERLIIINEGDFETPLNIEIKPKSDSIAIRNEDTNDVCELINLGGVQNISIDGVKGQIRKDGQLAFEHHKKGYINLLPETKMQTLKFLFKQAGNKGKVALINKVELQGKYFKHNNEIYKIVLADENGNITTDKPIDIPTSFTSRPFNANSIEIIGQGEFKLWYEERKL